MNIIINPKDKILLGDPVHIQVETESDSLVSVHLRRYYFDGDIDYSFAEFEPINGLIDTEISKPVSGSYSNSDISGLFWSQKNTSYELDLDIEFLSELTEADQGYFIVDIYQEESHESFKWLIERVSEDVKELILDNDQIQGKLYYKESSGPQPLIIHLAGEPGIDYVEVNAKLMASKGIASLALPICGYKNLPDSFKEIPLEQIMNTIDYIKSLDLIDDTRIGLFGSTRGAELALLIGSKRNDLKLIIAANPSDVVNQSVVKQMTTSKSSWSWEGKALSYSKVKKSKVFKLYTNRIASNQISQLMKSVYSHDTATQLIPVEQITAKVLLLAGESDDRWDSMMMATRIKSKINCEVVSYSNTGHVLGGPGCLSTMGFEQLSFSLGGTPEANGKSQHQSWKRIIGFVKSSL